LYSVLLVKINRSDRGAIDLSHRKHIRGSGEDE